MSIDVVLRAGSLFMKIYGHMGKKLLLLKIQGISRILGSSALFHLRNEICDFKFATLVLLFAFCTLFEIIFFLCCLLVWLLRFAFLYSLLSYFVMAFIETCIFKQNSNLLVGQKKNLLDVQVIPHHLVDVPKENTIIMTVYCQNPKLTDCDPPNIT